MKMTLAQAACFAAFTLLAQSASAATWQAVETISGQTPLTVTVNEKPRQYFRVSGGMQLPLTVEGPARLRMVSRAELPLKEDHAVSYRVQVLEKGILLKEHATESSVAKDVQLASGQATLCKSRSMVVDIPAGTHPLEIRVTGVLSVLVRLLLSAPGRDQSKMVSISPIDAPRTVTLAEGEKLIPYYTTFSGKPVTFRVVGPTSLELSTRLDFDATMRGSHSYRISVTSSGKRIHEATFSTTKATTASYTDLKDRSASKMSQFVVSLGPGSHVLTVELVEPKGGSAEVHARIPEPLVGSAE